MGARATEIVVVPNMTDQDSAAVDQSNHAEDEHHEPVKYVERTDMINSGSPRLQPWVQAIGPAKELPTMARPGSQWD